MPNRGPILLHNETILSSHNLYVLLSKTLYRHVLQSIGQTPVINTIYDVDKLGKSQHDPDFPYQVIDPVGRPPFHAIHTIHAYTHPDLSRYSQSYPNTMKDPLFISSHRIPLSCRSLEHGLVAVPLHVYSQVMSILPLTTLLFCPIAMKAPVFNIPPLDTKLWGFSSVTYWPYTYQVYGNTLTDQHSSTISDHFSPPDVISFPIKNAVDFYPVQQHVKYLIMEYLLSLPTLLYQYPLSSPQSPFSPSNYKKSLHLLNILNILPRVLMPFPIMFNTTPSSSILHSNDAYTHLSAVYMLLELSVLFHVVHKTLRRSGQSFLSESFYGQGIKDTTGALVLSTPCKHLIMKLITSNDNRFPLLQSFPASYVLFLLSVIPSEDLKHLLCHPIYLSSTIALYYATCGVALTPLVWLYPKIYNSVILESQTRLVIPSFDRNTHNHAPSMVNNHLSCVDAVDYSDDCVNKDHHHIGAIPLLSSDALFYVCNNNETLTSMSIQTDETVNMTKKGTNPNQSHNQNDIKKNNTSDMVDGNSDESVEDPTLTFRQLSDDEIKNASIYDLSQYHINSLEFLSKHSPNLPHYGSIHPSYCSVNDLPSGPPNDNDRKHKNTLHESEQNTKTPSIEPYAAVNTPLQPCSLHIMTYPTQHLFKLLHTSSYETRTLQSFINDTDHTSMDLHAQGQGNQLDGILYQLCDEIGGDQGGDTPYHDHIPGGSSNGTLDVAHHHHHHHNEHRRNSEQLSLSHYSTKHDIIRDEDIDLVVSMICGYTTFTHMQQRNASDPEVCTLTATQSELPSFKIIFQNVNHHRNRQQQQQQQPQQQQQCHPRKHSQQHIILTNTNLSSISLNPNHIVMYPSLQLKPQSSYASTFISPTPSQSTSPHGGFDMWSRRAEMDIFKAMDLLSPSPSISMTKGGVKGLVNVGNTCFMNSILQCFNTSTPFLNLILNPLRLGVLTNPNSDYKGQVLRNLMAVYSLFWRDNPKLTTFAPIPAKQSLEMVDSEFKGYRQHDSQEALLAFVNALIEDTNQSRIKSLPPITDIHLLKMREQTQTPLTKEKQEDKREKLENYFRIGSSLPASSNRQSKIEPSLLRKSADAYFTQQLQFNRSLFTLLFQSVTTQEMSCTSCGMLSYGHDTTPAFRVVIPSQPIAKPVALQFYHSSCKTWGDMIKWNVDGYLKMLSQRHEVMGHHHGNPSDRSDRMGNGIHVDVNNPHSAVSLQHRTHHNQAPANTNTNDSTPNQPGPSTSSSSSPYQIISKAEPTVCMMITQSSSPEEIIHFFQEIIFGDNATRLTHIKQDDLFCYRGRDIDLVAYLPYANSPLVPQPIQLTEHDGNDEISTQQKQSRPMIQFIDALPSSERIQEIRMEIMKEEEQKQHDITNDLSSLSIQSPKVAVDDNEIYNDATTSTLRLVNGHAKNNRCNDDDGGGDGARTVDDGDDIHTIHSSDDIIQSSDGDITIDASLRSSTTNTYSNANSSQSQFLIQSSPKAEKYLPSSVLIPMQLCPYYYYQQLQHQSPTVTTDYTPNGGGSGTHAGYPRSGHNNMNSHGHSQGNIPLHDQHGQYHHFTHAPGSVTNNEYYGVEDNIRGESSSDHSSYESNIYDNPYTSPLFSSKDNTPRSGDPPVGEKDCLEFIPSRMEYDDNIFHTFGIPTLFIRVPLSCSDIHEYYNTYISPYDDDSFGFLKDIPLPFKRPTSKPVTPHPDENRRNGNGGSANDSAGGDADGDGSHRRNGVCNLPLNNGNHHRSQASHNAMYMSTSSGEDIENTIGRYPLQDAKKQRRQDGNHPGGDGGADTSNANNTTGQHQNTSSKLSVIATTILSDGINDNESRANALHDVVGGHWQHVSICGSSVVMTSHNGSGPIMTSSHIHDDDDDDDDRGHKREHENTQPNQTSSTTGIPASRPAGMSGPGSDVGYVMQVGHTKNQDSIDGVHNIIDYSPSNTEDNMVLRNQLPGSRASSAADDIFHESDSTSTRLSAYGIMQTPYQFGKTQPNSPFFSAYPQDADTQQSQLIPLLPLAVNECDDQTNVYRGNSNSNINHSNNHSHMNNNHCLSRKHTYTNQVQVSSFASSSRHISHTNNVNRSSTQSISSGSDSEFPEIGFNYTHGAQPHNGFTTTQHTRSEHEDTMTVSTSASITEASVTSARIDTDETSATRLQITHTHHHHHHQQQQHQQQQHCQHNRIYNQKLTDMNVNVNRDHHITPASQPTINDNHGLMHGYNHYPQHTYQPPSPRRTYSVSHRNASLGTEHPPIQGDHHYPSYQDRATFSYNNVQHPSPHYHQYGQQLGNQYPHGDGPQDQLNPQSQLLQYKGFNFNWTPPEMYHNTHFSYYIPSFVFLHCIAQELIPLFDFSMLLDGYDLDQDDYHYRTVFLPYYSAKCRKQFAIITDCELRNHYRMMRLTMKLTEALSLYIALHRNHQSIISLATLTDIGFNYDSVFQILLPMFFFDYHTLGYTMGADQQSILQRLSELDITGDGGGGDNAQENNVSTSPPPPMAQPSPPRSPQHGDGTDEAVISHTPKPHDSDMPHNQYDEDDRLYDDGESDGDSDDSNDDNIGLINPQHTLHPSGHGKRRDDFPTSAPNTTIEPLQFPSSSTHNDHDVYHHHHLHESYHSSQHHHYIEQNNNHIPLPHPSPEGSRSLSDKSMQFDMDEEDDGHNDNGDTEDDVQEGDHENMIYYDYPNNNLYSIKESYNDNNELQSPKIDPLHDPSSREPRQVDYHYHQHHHSSLRHSHNNLHTPHASYSPDDVNPPSSTFITSQSTGHINNSMFNSAPINRTKMRHQQPPSQPSSQFPAPLQVASPSDSAPQASGVAQQHPIISSHRVHHHQQSYNGNLPERHQSLPLHHIQSSNPPFGVAHGDDSTLAGRLHRPLSVSPSRKLGKGGPRSTIDPSDRQHHNNAGIGGLSVSSYIVQSEHHQRDSHGYHGNHMGLHLSTDTYTHIEHGVSFMSSQTPHEGSSYHGHPTRGLASNRQRYSLLKENAGIRGENQPYSYHSRDLHGGIRPGRCEKSGRRKRGKRSRRNQRAESDATNLPNTHNDHTTTLNSYTAANQETRMPRFTLNSHLITPVIHHRPLTSSVGLVRAYNMLTQTYKCLTIRDLRGPDGDKLLHTIHNQYARYSEYDVLSNWGQVSDAPITLEDCIQSALAPSFFDANCSECHKTTRRKCTPHITRLPPVLIIYFERFSFTGQKKSSFVDYPTHSFSMSEFVYDDIPEDETIYDLTGVTVHTGGMASGHYYAYGLHPHKKDEWHCLNDQSTSVCEKVEDVVTPDAYLLFYQQRNPPSINKELEKQILGESDVIGPSPSIPP